jgi:hypothetical protein
VSPFTDQSGSTGPNRSVRPDPYPLHTYRVATPSVINGLVPVLFNVINDRSQCVFASLIHCYRGVCNNES